MLFSAAWMAVLLPAINLRAKRKSQPSIWNILQLCGLKSGGGEAGRQAELRDISLHLGTHGHMYKTPKPRVGGWGTLYATGRRRAFTAHQKRNNIRNFLSTFTFLPFAEIILKSFIMIKIGRKLELKWKFVVPEAMDWDSVGERAAWMVPNVVGAPRARQE